MDIAIKVIGIIFVFMAVVFLVKPVIFQNIAEFFKHGRRLYLAGVLRFALAVVFLLGAGDCDKFWPIMAIGILFMISGLLVFTISRDKLKSIIGWWQKQPVLIIRVLALIFVGFGSLILYSA